jgi:hypothetical protein
MSQFLVKEVKLARGGRKPQKKQSAGVHGHGNGWNNVKRRSMMKANRVGQAKPASLRGIR